MTDKVFACMIIGTDADIAGYTIKHLLAEGMDKILIDLVPVEDNTDEIVYELARHYPRQIEIFPSDTIAIWGSRRMTRLANLAYERGAELILPCDADELFFSKKQESLADTIRKAEGWVWGTNILSHMPSADDNPNEPNPYKRIKHRAVKPAPLDKVMIRFNPNMVIEEGNHGASWKDSGNRIPGEWIAVEMRHFSYRSSEQFVNKVRLTEKAMNATPGYPASFGVHYRVYADALHRGGEEHLKEWFYRWFYTGGPTSEAQEVLLAPAPYKGVD